LKVQSEKSKVMFGLQIGFLDLK